jgi:hypothetical protein
MEDRPGLRQRDGEAWPVQAAADDQDIRVVSHVRDYGPAPGIVHGPRGSLASDRDNMTGDGRRYGHLALAERERPGARDRAGEIDPVALTEAYLEAWPARTPRPDLHRPDAGARARRGGGSGGARKNGVRRGPLDGVPISWKDLFDTAGVATEAGSRLLEGRVPDADAEVLARATRAGLVCLGKTHMSELAFSGLG